LFQTPGKWQGIEIGYGGNSNQLSNKEFDYAAKIKDFFLVMIFYLLLLPC